MNFTAFMTSILCLIAVCASDVYACECVAPNQRQAYGKATAVFVGKVIEINDRVGSNEKASLNEGLYRFVVKFKIEAYWKGGDKTEIVIVAAQSEICSGFKFEIGKRYLVYAYGANLIAKTSCDRTVPVNGSDAAKDLRRLGKGKTPS